MFDRKLRILFTRETRPPRDKRIPWALVGCGSAAPCPELSLGSDRTSIDRRSTCPVGEWCAGFSDCIPWPEWRQRCCGDNDHTDEPKWEVLAFLVDVSLGKLDETSGAQRRPWPLFYCAWKSCGKIDGSGLSVSVTVWLVWVWDLLEGNMVCPARPDLQIDELLLWAWTEQESHACNYQARQCLYMMIVWSKNTVVIKTREDGIASWFICLLWEGCSI